MTERDLRLTAIDTVVRYAAQQGVKLRPFDFDDVDNEWHYNKDFELEYNNCVHLLRDAGNHVVSVTVMVAYDGRWAKQLKEAKERFLDYFNARLEDHHLTFSFTVNELEIIAMKKNGGGENADEEKIEKVIKKISKLLALGDTSRNPSENEAIAASLMAQKLLAKYNLTLTDVTGERKNEDVKQSVADVGSGKKWKFTLAYVVANNFACKHFVVGREQIVFYGYEADIVAARRVFVYLFKVGDKLANQLVRRHRERYGAADGVYNSFTAGFITGVRSELEKQCKALALVVQPEVQKSFEVFSAGFGQLKNCKISANDEDAFNEGVVEGRRALNAQYLDQ